MWVLGSVRPSKAVAQTVVKNATQALATGVGTFFAAAVGAAVAGVGSGARSADRRLPGAREVGSTDERAADSALRAGLRSGADALVAGGTDQPHGPVGCYRPCSAAAGAGPLGKGPAGPARHGAASLPVARALSAADRAGRLDGGAPVAAVADSSFSFGGAIGAAADPGKVTAAGAEVAGLACALVAGLAQWSVRTVRLGRGQSAARRAGTHRLSPAPLADRAALRVAARGRARPTAACTRNLYLWIVEVAPVADPSFGPASHDQCGPTASRTEFRLALGSAPRADPALRAGQQRGHRRTAACAGRQDDSIAGRVQTMRETDPRQRKVPDRPGGRVRAVVQEGLKLP